MKYAANKPTHITKGDVLDDLGLTRSQASALKFKATLLDAILEEIERRGFTQNQLVELLDEYQPSVSNLIRGKIAKLSLEKLLYYADRLKMKTTLMVSAPSSRPVFQSAARRAIPPGRKAMRQIRLRRRAMIG